MYIHMCMTDHTISTYVHVSIPNDSMCVLRLINKVHRTIKVYNVIYILHVWLIMPNDKVHMYIVQSNSIYLSIETCTKLCICVLQMQWSTYICTYTAPACPHNACCMLHQSHDVRYRTRSVSEWGSCAFTCNNILLTCLSEKLHV